MRKLFVFSAVVATMCAVSCKKTDVIESETGIISGNTVKIMAALPGEITKTAIGAAENGVYKVKWEESDVIAVNDKKSTSIELKDGGLTAEFTMEEGLSGDDFCAVYPASVYKSFNAASKKVSITLPSSQSYKAGTFDPNTAVIAAYSNDWEVLNFKQLMTYYKFTFTPGTGADANIATIVISQAGDQKNLAGAYDITCGETIGMLPTDLRAPIVYNCSEEGIPTNGTAIVAIPAMDYSTNGLIITVYDKDCKGVAYKINPDFSGKAGVIIERPLEFAPKEIKITTADEWEAFAAACNVSEPTKYAPGAIVTLGEDITAATFTQIKNLNYTFDGCGHTIKATAGTNALFGNIVGGGKVKRLIVDGTFTSQSVFCENLVGNNGNLAKIEDCINKAAINVSGAVDAKVAAFAPVAGWAEMTRCQNQGNITVAVSGTPEVNVGGLVDHIFVDNNSYSFTMTDCKNTGKIDVSVNNSGAIKYFSVGGIAAWVTRDYLNEKWPEVKFVNCDNAGGIEVKDKSGDSNSYVTTVGGILGRAWGDWVTNSSTVYLGVPGPKKDDVYISGGNSVKATFIDCDNSGNILNRTTSSINSEKLYAKSYTGGLVGAMWNHHSVYERAVDGTEKDITFLNCSSSGNVVPCDIMTDNHTRAGIESICGGFVGIGSHLYFKNCSVTAAVGTETANAFAVSGGLGQTISANSSNGAFTFESCVFYPSITHLRLFATGQNNWSLIATVTKATGTGSPEFVVKFAGTTAPAPKEMVVKNCQLGCALLKLNTDKPADFKTLPSTILNLTNSKFGTCESCEQYGIQGNDHVNNSGWKVTCYCAKDKEDATFSGNDFLNSAPSVTPTPVEEPQMAD